MNGYLIRYISPMRGECVDFQYGTHLFDAMCAHFRSFPASRRVVVRKL